MKKITEIKNMLSLDETLSTSQLVDLKGGLRRDDKRRQRPGGGTTTTTLSKSRFKINFEL
jgi:hypothetical protein